jgi:DNA-binding NarL/FixJ family response regulator
MARREGSVLIVDDDQSMRALVSSVLEHAGYETAEAASGEEALHVAHSPARPQVFILDVRLPGLSGYEVSRSLRDEFGEEISIIHLSGERVEPLDRAAGLHLGGDDFVVKPFAPEDLLARVDRLVSRSQARNGGTPSAPSLSGREAEVLGLIADGLKQGEIARRLVLSPKTVASHTRNLLAKLDVKTQAQAVAEGFRRRLLGN